MDKTVNFRIKIQYDGSRYNGWQIQKNTENTIQGKLQILLGRMFGTDIEVIGSGRTDAGVHALGQVANFHVPGNSVEEVLTKTGTSTPEDFLERVNSYLPEDIAVVSIERVDEQFHARFDAVEKTYRYRIHTVNISPVFERKYVYFYTEEKINTKLIREACEYLKGEHDFKSFCSNKHMKKSSVRTIYDITVTESDTDVIIDYKGNGFLQGMVRILTGTLIEIGVGKRKPSDIVSILEACNREKAGFTAPAEGLMLMEVKY